MCRTLNSLAWDHQTDNANQANMHSIGTYMTLGLHIKCIVAVANLGPNESTAPPLSTASVSDPSTHVPPMR